MADDVPLQLIVLSHGCERINHAVQLKRSVTPFVKDFLASLQTQYSLSTTEYLAIAHTNDSDELLPSGILLSGSESTNIFRPQSVCSYIFLSSR